MDLNNEDEQINTGIFLKNYIPNKKYDISNFSIMKDKQIGEGAFSKIYLSKNSNDDVLYACKIISKDNILEQKLPFEIVENEILIQERIIHPNIVRMYSHYEDKNYYYCFLEYISNKTLFGLIKGNKGKDNKKLTEEQTYKIMKQIINIILFLHNNNIIHRDIKPENFLLLEKNPNEYIIKLCDFGWSTILTKENPTKNLKCGTPEYMSPELIKEESYDYGTDIWAIGVLFYEMLHGYPPFGSCNGDDYNSIFNNIIEKEPKINDDLSDICKDLIKKILNKNKNKRINIKDIAEHEWIKFFSKKEEKKSNKINNNEVLRKNKKNESNNIQNILTEKKTKDECKIINKLQNQNRCINKINRQINNKIKKHNIRNFKNRYINIKTIDNGKNINSERNYINNCSTNDDNFEDIVFIGRETEKNEENKINNRLYKSLNNKQIDQKGYLGGFSNKLKNTEEEFISAMFNETKLKYEDKKNNKNVEKPKGFFERLFSSFNCDCS